MGIICVKTFNQEGGMGIGETSCEGRGVLGIKVKICQDLNIC